jgi:hypothetical protein
MHSRMLLSFQLQPIRHGQLERNASLYFKRTIQQLDGVFLSVETGQSLSQAADGRQHAGEPNVATPHQQKRAS